ncbi:MAG: rhomboid family intramembrane serine protease [Bacteroidales bacterium]|jgi:membrane associated rhomboid family serine protease|nr:rhomboid family intramembrane serine protease [Bacteroidales bacterium]
MSYHRPSGFSILPPIVKNLLLLNIAMFVLTAILQYTMKVDLTNILGLHYVGSENFKPLQFVTYMFMHGSLSHIFFNMFALWMFGSAIEHVWGPQKFLLYYLVTGIGAGVLQVVFQHIQLMDINEVLSTEQVQIIKTQGAEVMSQSMNYTDSLMAKYNAIMNAPTVGASGAVFGLLLAFGMLFPDSYIYIYFAIPVKAKYFVMLYGLFELYMGIQNNPGDNVAHYAHLGGMLFGFLLIYYWKKKGTNI